MTYILRILGFVSLLFLIVWPFGLGEIAIYRKLAWYQEARAALRDPAQLDRVDANLTERMKADSGYYVKYSFKVPGNEVEYSSVDAWGNPASVRISEETFKSLGDQAKSISIVFLKRDPSIHEVAGDFDKPRYQREDGMVWRCLYAILITIELPLLAAAWWLCLGTRRGTETVHGSLGCKTGTRFVKNGTEHTYSLSPLTASVAGKSVQREHACPRCGATVSLSIRTWTNARGEALLIVVGMMWCWLIVYAIFAVLNFNFRWVGFPWTTAIFSAGAIIVAAISFLWVVKPGFQEFVKVVNSDSHATFNRIT